MSIEGPRKWTPAIGGTNRGPEIGATAEFRQKRDAWFANMDEVLRDIDPTGEKSEAGKVGITKLREARRKQSAA